jgi:hypothetical protein
MAKAVPAGSRYIALTTYRRDGRGVDHARVVGAPRGQAVCCHLEGDRQGQAGTCHWTGMFRPV